MMERRLLTAFLKLELVGHTVRLIDGGTLTVAGETYEPRDSVVGVVASFDALSEGVADEAPAGTIGFDPPSDVPSWVLVAPAVQNARLRLWTAEIDAETGLAIGTPEQMIDWLVDVPTLRFSEGVRRLDLLLVGSGERLFQIERGNSLSPAVHRAIYPNEAGLDNASGVPFQSPWGAPSPPRGISSATPSYGGGGGGYFNVQFQ